MSRRSNEGHNVSLEPPLSEEEAQAIEESLDEHTLDDAKDILCMLWKQDRITLEARTAGERALSAAIQAVTRPHLRKIGLMAGAALSPLQWWEKQARHDHDF